MVFDYADRKDTNPKLNRESHFVFLNRSARSEIARVRDLVELCVRAYPGTEREELVARIRCGNDTNFKSAMFELLLHATLERLGCNLEPHPTLENDSKARPDFMVTTPDGSKFYLEAVLASESNESVQAAEARKGVVMDALASAKHDNFMVDVQEEGDPDTQPRGKTLVRDVLRWLNSLDPDVVQVVLEKDGLDAAPTFAWQHEGWSVRFRPIPLRPERRGKSLTLLGIQGGGAKGELVDAWSPIRKAVRSKASKYGALSKPFLVAVNMESFHLDRIDEMQALYGQEQYVFTVGQPGKEPKFQRAPNGAWYGNSGPEYTRVSGLWIFNDLSPYTVAVRRQTVYFNPWASLVLPDILRSFPHASANESKMEWMDGVSLRDVFRLSEGWPNDGL